MTTPAVPLIVGGLFAWSLFRRVRRNIGRQPLRPVRLIISLVILSLVTALLVGLSLSFPSLLLGMGGGLILGAALGIVGLRLTKFETTEHGHFYTPNTHIGVALSLLLLGRMLYRMWVWRDAAAVAPAGQPQLFHSPLTFFIFGLTAGYYLLYRAGLFLHTRSPK